MADGPGKVIGWASPARLVVRGPRRHASKPIAASAGDVGWTSTRRAMAIATLAVVGAGVLFRAVRYLANWPLWGDEAFLAVSLITRDFAGLARPLDYFQIAPAGFLWVERAVIGVLGAGEWAMRLVPFLAGLASLGLFWRFAEGNLERRAALLAVALFAASFYPIRHSTEVKPYATDLLLSLALTCLARRAWSRPESDRAWLALTATSALGVWSSYPLIFVAGGVGLTLGVRIARGPSRRAVVLWAGFVVSTLASWAVMYVATARPQSLAAPFYRDMPTWEDSFPPVLRPWELPWWLAKIHTGNMMAYPYGGNNFGSVATALLVLVGARVLWRRDRALLGLLVGPVAPAFLAAAMHRYPYGTSARISLYLAPAICLLAGQGLAAILLRSLPRKHARRALLIVPAGLAAVAIGGAVVAAAMPYKGRVDATYRDLVRSLAAQARPGDRWVGFNGLDDLPPIKGLMLMPWLAHAAQFHFYVLRDAPVPLAWSPDPPDLTPDPPGRTWFLLNRVGYDRFPEGLLGAHLLALTDRLGPPDVRSYPIVDRESVSTYIFAPLLRCSADKVDRPEIWRRSAYTHTRNSLFFALCLCPESNKAEGRRTLESVLVLSKLPLRLLPSAASGRDREGDSGGGEDGHRRPRQEPGGPGLRDRLDGLVEREGDGADEVEHGRADRGPHEAADERAGDPALPPCPEPEGQPPHGPDGPPDRAMGEEGGGDIHRRHLRLGVLVSVIQGYHPDRRAGPDRSAEHQADRPREEPGAERRPGQAAGHPERQAKDPPQDGIGQRRILALGRHALRR